MTEQGYDLSTQAAEFYESTFVPALFGGWARRLVDFADIRAGESVLDVACGTGIVARTAAEGIGAEAVVGLDVNESMLAVARTCNPDVRWVHGDATDLPFGDDAFDVVLCQAALMFFPDRVGALREMARVAGTDGRVAVQVPGRLDHSAGYLALTDVVARHAGTEVLDLLGSYFAVGDPGLLRSLADEAELAVTRFESWTSATRLPSLDQFLDVELLPIAHKVDSETRTRILADAATELAPFVDEHGAIAAPIEVHLLALHRR
jgi:ubiquinone/menaquinone biosynthesis C-methylase UbiE